MDGREVLARAGQKVAGN